jgi:hypothetical protein
MPLAGTSHRRRTASALAGVLALATALALAGCGGSERELKITVAGGIGKNPVTVKAPKSTTGGLKRITLKDNGNAPLDGQLVRVDGNHSAQEVLHVVQGQGTPIPGWIHGAGGVGQVRPHKSATVVQNLAPGRYYIFSGEDVKPGIAPLTVKGGKPGKLPKTQATITTREYTFDVSGLKAGKEKVLFRNAGRELHHVIAAPMLPGKTLAEVKKFVSQAASNRKPPSGRPPIDMNGGFQTTVLDPGIAQVIDVDLKPGRYALMCFINDRKGGPPHVMKGMLKEVDVK